MKRLAIEDVRKLLGGRPALDGVSITWDRPGTLVVFGENGAGKSTLLRVAAGVLAADAGEVRIFGHRLSTDRLAALRHVGYAPEAADLPAHLGVGELVALVAALKGVPRPPAELAGRLGVSPSSTSASAPSRWASAAAPGSSPPSRATPTCSCSTNRPTASTRTAPPPSPTSSTSAPPPAGAPSSPPTTAPSARASPPPPWRSAPAEPSSTAAERRA